MSWRRLFLACFVVCLLAGFFYTAQASGETLDAVMVSSSVPAGEGGG